MTNRTAVLSKPSLAPVSQWSHRLVFFALAAISVAIWWGPLTSWFALAIRDERYTHMLLIFPISAALIFLSSELLERSVGWSVRIGVNIPRQSRGL